MINLLKKEISNLIYKIKSNDKDCNCIDYQIYNVIHNVFDIIEQYNEDNINTNQEIKIILAYIKRKFYKYARIFDSFEFKHYNYIELIKELQEIDNKLNCVI